MIRIESVTKRFGDKLVLDDVSLDVPDRRVLVILGPSGMGKTVLLRVMTGLLASDAGHVSYDGVRLRFGAFADNQATLRRIGYVSQTGSLFDSLSVAENVALPLRELFRLRPEDLWKRVDDALRRVGMGACGAMSPAELSGGMTRLVAIARALTTDPHYVFFDEPTSGLDPVMRERICRLIAGLRDEENRTVVVVTHDLDAVEAVADDILMLRGARLVPLERARKEDYEQIGA